MDSTRWALIQPLFHDALNLPQPERRVFLQRVCADDQDLIAEVLALVEEDARGGLLLDRDLARVADGLLQEGASSIPSQDFGPYRIQSFLGEGGMGVVYSARRDDLGNLVAIKILRDAWLSPARRERFESEQRTLAQLNHPLIAKIYDADTLADGTPWFAMEYVDGLPLTDYSKKRECSIQQRLELFRSVCEAVQYLHANAVIHRDLKPSNILVDSSGAAKLLDFGIAKHLEAFDSPVDQTRTALRLMTPAYAAPEQIRGEGVGVQTDVYSLGVILYELLTGRLPYDFSNRTAADVEALLDAREAEKPSVVASQATGSPGGKGWWADLDVLCLTAIHRDRERRYRSVEALVRDIDHYLKGEPLEARPDTLRYRAAKFVGRNRRAVFTSSVVLVAVLGLVVFFAIRLAAARNAALAEAARVQRIQKFMVNLFQGGDKTVGPPENLRVGDLIERGVREARGLDRDTAVQAELYQTLGDIYHQLSDFPRADALLTSALERRRSLFGPDHPEVARTEVALGLLRMHQGQLPEAERLTREGLDIANRRLPAGHPEIAEATSALGRVLEERGTYDKAIEVLNEAVRLQSAPDVPPEDLASSLTELANSHFYAGHYAVSESLNQKALAIYKRMYGDRHPLVADILINLGAIQLELGHYAEAERFDRQALTITEDWYGKDNPATAAAMTLLARALNYEGRFDKSAALLEGALTIQEKALGPSHARVASTLNEMGQIAIAHGDLEGAERDFKRVVDIYRTVYGDKHYYVAVGLSNLASAYLKGKHYDRAEPIFRDVIQRYKASLSADHNYTAIARIKLGRTLVGEHRYADAEVESLAGYQILSRQISPSVSWIKSARQDLSAEYEALGQPEKAGKFRAELAGPSK